MFTFVIKTVLIIRIKMTIIQNILITKLYIIDVLMREIHEYLFFLLLILIISRIL